jgi:hypothetical protein
MTLSLKPLGILFIVTSLFGCAATKEGMTVSAVNSGGVYEHNIVVGDVKGNLFVDNEVLRQSLIASLELNRLSGTRGSVVRVDLDLWKLEPALDMGAGVIFYSEYVAQANYKVYDEGGVIKNYPVTSKGKVTLAEMPIGEMRANQAREKAVKGNLEQFIKAVIKDDLRRK